WSGSKPTKRMSCCEAPCPGGRGPLGWMLVPPISSSSSCVKAGPAVTNSSASGATSSSSRKHHRRVRCELLRRLVIVRLHRATPVHFTWRFPIVRERPRGGARDEGVASGRELAREVADRAPGLQRVQVKA